MAAHELIDYIENGNIVNSVNMPAVSMGRTSDARVCVIHKNIPGIISAITTALADQNINVHNMQNASKGDYAYSLLDVETVFDGIEDKLMAVEGIIRVRVIK
jgi:D-3-phosphoglycerate dehydrogenase